MGNTINMHGGQRPGPVDEGLLTACKSALVEASKLPASELKELTFVPSSESRSEQDRRAQLVHPASSAALAVPATSSRVGGRPA